MNQLGINDAYLLMNEAISQSTGQKTTSVLDTSSFTTVGETVLRTGNDAFLNAISYVLGRTIFTSRPYKRRLYSLEVEAERWGLQDRKITYLSNEFEESKNLNTIQNPATLVDGQSVDMYEINKPKALQLNFYGAQALQAHITRSRDELAGSFANERSFNAFWSGAMIEFDNMLELAREERTRLTLLNFMGGISIMGTGQIDLTDEYNRKYGTIYTREQLLTTHFESFLKFLVSYINLASERLKDMSTLNHANIAGYAPIRRHTPASRQRMVMNAELFVNARANVLPSIFNPEYLNIGSYENVTYWQSQQEPNRITLKPNYLDVTTGASKTSNINVNLPYVVGLLYDVEALGVLPKFDYASTTPFNSAGGYWNSYIHWLFQSYNDFTENAILFVIGAGGEAPVNSRSLLTAPVKATRRVKKKDENEDENEEEKVDDK